MYAALHVRHEPHRLPACLSVCVFSCVRCSQVLSMVNSSTCNCQAEGGSVVCDDDDDDDGDVSNAILTL